MTGYKAISDEEKTVIHERLKRERKEEEAALKKAEEEGGYIAVSKDSARSYIDYHRYFVIEKDYMFPGWLWNEHRGYAVIDREDYLNRELFIEEDKRIPNTFHDIKCYMKDVKFFNDRHDAVKDWELRNPPKTKKKKEEKEKSVGVKTSVEDLKTRLRSGLITERGLGISLLHSGAGNCPHPDWSYKTWWIGDLIAKAIYDDYGIADEPENFQMDIEELEEFERITAELKELSEEEYERSLRNVVFTCEELRTKTRRKLSDAEISTLIDEFNDTPIIRNFNANLN